MKYWISHISDKTSPALKLIKLNCKGRVHLWSSNRLVVGDSRESVVSTVH